MNPINIARGLLDKHEQVKDTDPDMAAQIRGDLETMADDIREAVGELRGLVDPTTMELEGGKKIPTVAAAEIKQVGLQLDDLLSGGRSSTPAAKRTAKAPEAPNKTTP